MKPLLRALFTFLLFALTMSFLFACSQGSEQETGSSQTSHPPQTTEPPVNPPKLTELHVEGGYELSFSAEITSYTVQIPAGRPAVPQVSAKAEENASLTIHQATIPDQEESGTARITVTKDGVSCDYTVTFVKDAAQGFQLQYADVYTYAPAYTPKEGEKLTFSSSNTSVLTVDNTGKVTAVDLSDTATIITASVGATEVGRLVVDRVIKAPLNIFLIIGQSNAYGWHDVPAGATQSKYFSEQKRQYDTPLPGTVWGDSVTTAYDDYSFSGMQDLCSKRGFSGFHPALGKEWYALTGEKSLMLKTAVGSTPIEAWTADPSLMFYGIDLYAMTVERFRYYEELFATADSKFTVNRIYAFWLQGETCQEYVYDSSKFTWANKNGQTNYPYYGDWRKPTRTRKLMTSEEYYSYFMSMYQSLVKDIGLEFIGILPTRAMESVSSEENRREQQLVDLVAPRAAQFALNYRDNGNIAIVTLKTEIGRTESYADKTAEGWGYLGCYNIHYNQLGYNAIGKDAAMQTYYRLVASEAQAATDICVLDTDGRTVLTDGETIRIECGSTRQITAYVLPLFAADSTLQFSISDTNLCTIDDYGVITVPYHDDTVGKTATLTISNGVIQKVITLAFT
ncbi:MAG: hypothetical protein E7618_02360 [Ruminococcaceae bacterium]|nr:hypothetical protein [Oscillospiraceae bacterium]